MANSISRTYTFSNGGVADGGQVDSEVQNIVNTINNADAGTTAWTQVKTGILTTTGVTTLKGTTTNDNAAAGNVGEVIVASVSFGSPTSLSSGVPITIASISLTAGQWSVVAMGGLKPTNAGTSITNKVMAISLTDNTLPSNATYMVPNASGEVRWDDVILAYVAGVNQQVMMGTIQSVVKLASTTTVYFVEQAGFTVSTCTGFGSITATRIR